MELKIREVAEWIGAKNEWEKWGDLSFNSVEFDTRKVSTGTLFVPLQGGQRDGHDFFEVAREKGAVVSLFAENIEEIPGDFPILIVEDTLVAFQKLAQYYLEKIGAKVIGVTGSNGKTTTKDMVESVLAQGFKTYKTQGNYNNHIGLPYTILSMPVDTEMLVLEMGMDHFGEIEVLSKLATPDIAAITMIGESHLEFLGTRKGIAQAKMEIVAGLKPQGLLIVPGDEPLLTSFLEGVSQEVVTFGLEDGNQITAKIKHETRTTTTFTVNKLDNSEVTIPVLGSYNVKNALIAITIGQYVGLTDSQIIKGLALLNLTQSRTEWLKATNGAEILSDVYNANPTAMSLVIQAFEGLETIGKKMVVLADMGELGEQSKELHESIAAYLNPETIQEVYLYGTQMAALKEKLVTKYAPAKLHYYPVEAKSTLLADVEESLTSDDMLMLKGSNSMKLIEIVEKITEN